MHQQAPISLMYYLRNDDVLTLKDSVLFLTPCHSTPFYSFLHKEIPMKFLTCEPNINRSISNYLDEADKFWINPNKWFDTNRQTVQEATHVVLFENLYNRLMRSNRTSDYMNGFKLCKKFYHSFAKTTERTDRYLFLMCKNLTDSAQNEINQEL